MIKHTITPYNRSSGPTPRRYRMGFCIWNFRCHNLFTPRIADNGKRVSRSRSRCYCTTKLWGKINGRFATRKCLSCASVNICKVNRLENPAALGRPALVILITSNSMQPEGLQGVMHLIASVHHHVCSTLSTLTFDASVFSLVCAPCICQVCRMPDEHSEYWYI